MMEESNSIFLPGGDALEYLTEPIKNIPQNLFEAIHLVRTYLFTNFLTLLSLYAQVHFLDDPLLFFHLRTYLMDRLFLKQKANRKIRLLYLLKYKHSNIINSLRAIAIQIYCNWSQSRYLTFSHIIIVHFKS